MNLCIIDVLELAVSLSLIWSAMFYSWSQINYFVEAAVSRCSRLGSSWIIGMIIIAASTGYGGAPPENPVKGVKSWNGEFFRKKEGGLFVNIRPTGFPSRVVGNAQITLYGIIEKQSYVFLNAQTEEGAPPHDVWKVSSGKYRIESVEFVDHKGKKRRWSRDPKSPMFVIVSRLMLSNLGLWELSPRGENELAIKFLMAPNTYQEKVSVNDSAVVAVISGFTGTIQAVIGGKNAIKGAGNTSERNVIQMNENASVTRDIDMHYRVELFKHQKHAKSLLASITAFDRNLRGCYLAALELDFQLKGDLVFHILTSSITGTIRQAKKNRGSIANAGMIDCLITELQQIPMPVQENMIGELTFSFNVK